MTSFLRDRTHHDEAYWMEWVQCAIANATMPTADPNHGETNVALWIGRLEQELTRIFRASGLAHAQDENLWMASTMGHILALWYAQVQYAKAYDPKRPIEVRQASLVRLDNFQYGVLDAIFDMNQVEDFFPAQQWENPNAAEATDGTFV